MRLAVLVGAWVVIVVVAAPLAAKKKEAPASARLAEYLEKARAAHPPSPANGSLWTAHSPFATMTADDKARHVNDIIIIRVVEQTRAEADGNVKSQRKLNAESGISHLFGPLGPRSGLQAMFSPSSTQSLDGQAQAASSSLLRTSLAGRVVEVLPNGYLVVEAVRAVEMNNQQQVIVLRGVVRPTDITPDNAVLSTALSNLEVELKGKGVISDGVRPPNRIVRLLLRLLGF